MKTYKIHLATCVAAYMCALEKRSVNNTELAHWKKFLENGLNCEEEQYEVLCSFKELEKMEQTLFNDHTSNNRFFDVVIKKNKFEISINWQISFDDLNWKILSKEPSKVQQKIREIQKKYKKNSERKQNQESFEEIMSYYHNAIEKM